MKVAKKEIISEREFLLAVSEAVQSALPSELAATAEALSVPGSGLRPKLVYASALCLADAGMHADPMKLITLGTVVELLHTASLIHDDIIDDEPQRRGRSSLHASFGPVQAVLAGNLFYISAFAKTFHILGEQQTEAILVTASHMLEGELLQLQNASTPLCEETYRSILTKKTGRLMAMACSETARLAGADSELISQFHLIGETIGLLYQMRDDAADKDISLQSGLDLNDLISLEKNRLYSLIRPVKQPIYSDYSPLQLLIECIFH